LLDKENKDLEAKLYKRNNDNIKKFEGTLFADGRSSITNQPLINAMLVSSVGE